MQRIALVLVIHLLLVARAIAGPVSAPIVGGTTVSSKDWPDVVGLIGTDGVCTGTLVAPDVVVTAGHCIELGLHTVITHADDLAPGSPGERLPVKWTRAYPDWLNRYDIGVVVLQRVARVKPRAIAAACIANDRLRAGASITVLGYGLIAPDASDDNSRLHAARLPVTDPFCANAPGCLANVRPNGELAAGGRGSDSCYGDSGGPAYLDTPSGPALVAVVSRGLAVPGLPCSNGGIYVRADKVVAWIQSVTERELERVTCGRPGDESDETGPDADASDVGGCSTHRGSGGLFLLAVVLSPRLGRRRRRA